MRYLFGMLVCFLLATSAVAGEFTLSSPAFKDKSRIPVLFTCDGDNISPPLDWKNPPAGTQSFVLDFEAVNWVTMNIYLWVVYNIPGDVRGFSQDIYELPKGALVGTNFYDQNKYRGPCPPDTEPHEYVFKLYALDTVLYPVEDEIDPDKLKQMIKNHILGSATLSIFFSH